MGVKDISNQKGLESKPLYLLIDIERAEKIVNSISGSHDVKWYLQKGLFIKVFLKWDFRKLFFYFPKRLYQILVGLDEHKLTPTHRPRQALKPQLIIQADFQLYCIKDRLNMIAFYNDKYSKSSV